MRELALLRGINVVGRRIVPMAALADVFRSLRCQDVATYIQSGNVIFTAPAEGLTASTMSAALEQRFGFAIPVILRTASELSLLIAANPFATADYDPKALHVVFLHAAPPLTSLPMLDAAAAPGEEFALGTRVLYLNLPAGVGRSKLAQVPGKPRFGTHGTMRNWNTTLKLAQLLEAGRS
jgi:uncharacterized protein (DUF1697 family)